MGLAPYGNSSPTACEYIQKIKSQLIDIREDGSFLLNMDYFDYATGLTMTNSQAWEKLFSVPPRQPESEISQAYIDLAYAIQNVTEEVMYKLAVTAKRITGTDNLVLAGGVALNCVANGKIRRSKLFKDIWIQPAAGDAGGAVGAAFSVWHIVLGKERIVAGTDLMAGTYLGPAFTDREVENLIRNTDADTVRLSQEHLYERVADLLNSGAIVGWFQGRMEFGPRALGNRSILADPRNTDMQRKLNLEIKIGKVSDLLLPVYWRMIEWNILNQRLSRHICLSSTRFIRSNSNCCRRLIMRSLIWINYIHFGLSCRLSPMLIFQQEYKQYQNRRIRSFMSYYKPLSIKPVAVY